MIRIDGEHVVINGNLIDEDKCSVRYEGTENGIATIVTLKDRDFAYEFLLHRWHAIPKVIATLIIHNAFEWMSFGNFVTINVSLFRNDCESVPGNGVCKIHVFNSKENFQNEKFLQYCSLFTQNCEGTPFNCSFHFDIPMFIVDVDVNDRLMPESEKSIKSFLEPIEELLRHTHDGALVQINQRSDTNAVTLCFDFPETVRVPCEQYLLYFAEFLKDAGMNATADLKHEAGSVLFTVTPKGDLVAPEDAEEALDKIRQALGIFLSLPANPAIVQAQVYNQPPELLMLAATIKHLYSQLDYANAKAQAEAVTIQNQQALIGNLSDALKAMPQPITAEVFVQSVRAVVEKNKDAEAFLGGTVEITKYEGQGFNINLAAAVRHVKDLFAKRKDAALVNKELPASRVAKQGEMLQLPEKPKGGE